MGSSKSSEQKTENKVVDATGNVNNNVVIQDTVAIHNVEIIGLLYIIAGIKLIEFIYFIYRQHNRSIKKKYNNERNNNA